jgi:hypothetical protein
MPEGHAMMLTCEWWLSAFLMGLGIHLIALHLKPRLDQLGGWLSRSWATRNQGCARARQKRIDALKRSRDAKIEATIEEFRLRLSSLQWIFVACLSLLILILLSPNFKQPTYEVVLWVVFAFVTSLFGVKNILKGNTVRLEVVEAQKPELKPQVKRVEQLQHVEEVQLDEEALPAEDEMEQLMRQLFNENAKINIRDVGRVD